MNEGIIVFHLDDSSNLRGGERQVLYLAKELLELGIENYIVGKKNSPLVENSKKYSIPTITLPYLFEFDIISAVLLARKIKAINKNKKNVILHTHTGHTPTIALLTKLFIDAKIVVHRRVDFKLNNPFSKIKYSNADAIIVISNAIKEILESFKIPSSKIFLIPDSIPKDFIEVNIKPRRFPEKDIIVGSLISLVEHKDPLNLIEAARIVVKNSDKVYFEIAGDGYLMEECIKKIKEYGVENRVMMKGYITNNRDFLRKIDIFVLSSQEEGLGSCLIEAMAYALPLVGTDAGGIKEIIKNGVNGIVVPKKNPQKLAKAILKLSQDRELYERFSKNSLEIVRSYTSDIMARRTLKVYEKTIENTKPH